MAHTVAATRTPLSPLRPHRKHHPEAPGHVVEQIEIAGFMMVVQKCTTFSELTNYRADPRTECVNTERVVGTEMMDGGYCMEHCFTVLTMTKLRWILVRGLWQDQQC